MKKVLTLMIVLNIVNFALTSQGSQDKNQPLRLEIDSLDDEIQPLTLAEEEEEEEEEEGSWSIIYSCFEFLVNGNKKDE